MTTAARTRSRVAAGLAAGVLGLTLAACGGSRPAVPRVGLPTGRPASPSPSPSASVVPVATTVTGPAAAQFGARSATQGVRQAERFAELALGDGALLAARPHTIRDFEPLKPYLTDPAWAWLGGHVPAGSVPLLATAPLPDRFHPSGLAAPVTFSQVTTQVAGKGTAHPTLVVSFTTAATYAGTVTATGRAGTDKMTQAWNYIVMVPSGVPGTHGWQVASWHLTDSAYPPVLGQG